MSSPDVGRRDGSRCRPCGPLRGAAGGLDASRRPASRSACRALLAVFPPLCMSNFPTCLLNALQCVSRPVCLWRVSPYPPGLRALLGAQISGVCVPPLAGTPRTMPRSRGSRPRFSGGASDSSLLDMNCPGEHALVLKGLFHPPSNPLFRGLFRAPWAPSLKATIPRQKSQAWHRESVPPKVPLLPALAGLRECAAFFFTWTEYRG